MRRVLVYILSGVCVLSGLAGWLVFDTAVLAKAPDPADYPLRVHVLKNTARSRHSRESKSFSDAPDYLDGEGGADLFEEGQPLGFQFRYSCVDPLRASEAYATYPARWKKRDKTLEILIPQPGKPWNLEGCDLQVVARPGLAYFWNPDDDRVVEETAAKFKEWMVKHQYDPEKDLNDPIGLDAEPGAPGESGSSSSQTPPPK
jgi:hypothetical protein